MLVVEPVRDPVGEGLPLRLVLEHALPGAGVELLHAEALDVLLPAELELLLDLDLHRQPVGVPAGDAGDRFALHRVEAADQVLDGPGEDVMDAGPAVGGRRTLVEHEGRPALRGAPASAGKSPPPSRARAGARSSSSGVTSGQEGTGIRRAAPPAPVISRVSAGSARRAVAMIRSMSAGSSASGRHWSVMMEMPTTRMPRVHRHDHLGHGGHADDVRPDSAQHPVLGPGLEVGAGHRDVHAFAQRRCPAPARPRGPARGAPDRRAPTCRGTGARAARRWRRPAGCRPAG